MKDQIFGVGYRQLPERPKRRHPAWAIARTALTLAWRKRVTKLALFVCVSVVGVHGVWMMVQVFLRRMGAGYGEAMNPLSVTSLVGRTQDIFSSFLLMQFFFTALLLAVVGAGLIADDRKAGALHLYFARPLSRLEYATGKALAAFLVPAATMIAPVLVLWLEAVGVAHPALRAELWWLIAPGLLGATLSAMVLTALILGLSALGERARTVGAVFIGLLLVAGLVGETLPQAGYHWAGYFTPERDLRTVVNALLSVGDQSFGGQLLAPHSHVNPDPWISAGALVAYVLGGFGLVGWRLNKEVAG